MTREELEANLGTIAHSGSNTFLHELAEAARVFALEDETNAHAGHVFVFDHENPAVARHSSAGHRFNKGCDALALMRLYHAGGGGNCKNYGTLWSEAFNALIKPLEEPPAHVKFIFATTEPDKLPATIQSRCQRFDFRRIAVSGIVKDYQMGLETVHELRGVDLTIRAGEYVAIMGASGSGKATIMNVVGCLDRPTEGSYELNGTAVQELSDEELEGHLESMRRQSGALETVEEDRPAADDDVVVDGDVDGGEFSVRGPGGGDDEFVLGHSRSRRVVATVRALNQDWFVGFSENLAAVDIDNDRL